MPDLPPPLPEDPFGNVDIITIFRDENGTISCRHDGLDDDTALALITRVQIAMAMIQLGPVEELDCDCPNCVELYDQDEDDDEDDDDDSKE